MSLFFINKEGGKNEKVIFGSKFFDGACISANGDG
jgi:hypothetical protein